MRGRSRGRSSSSRASRRRSERPSLAGLAQLKMLDGIFSEAQRLAREAIKVARACDPVARAQEIHATTTLARRVRLGQRSRRRRSSSCARPSRRPRELDDPDALFRIRANLTTVLDLVGRRTEAVEVAYRGHRGRAPRRPRGRLRQLPGRQRRRDADPAGSLAGGPRAERARDELAAGRRRLSSPASLQLAIVEIETDAGEEASRLLGQTILEFDARPRAAARRPVLPGRRLVRAVARRRRRREPIRRAWLGRACAPTEDWVLVARMAAMVAQVDAAVGAEAREHRQLAPLAAARTADRRGARRPPSASSRAAGAPASAGSRRVAEAYLATARGVPAPARGRR